MWSLSSNVGPQHMCHGPIPTFIRYDSQVKHPHVKCPISKLYITWSQVPMAKCLPLSAQIFSSYVGTSHNQIIDSPIMYNQWVSQHVDEVNNLLGKGIVPTL